MKDEPERMKPESEVVAGIRAGYPRFPFRFILHPSSFILAIILTAATAHALDGKVAFRQGRPVLLVDGDPLYPMMYALTEGGRFTWEDVPQRNLRHFAELGFRLFQIDVWFRDIWAEDGSLDMNVVLRQIRGVLDVRVDAAVIIRLHVDAPHWWTRQNPGECVAYAAGPVEEDAGDLGRCLRNSLASGKWRDAASAKLVEFCSRLEEMSVGRALIGLHLAGGVYGEWHYWGFPHEPDTGLAMTRAFRAWLRAKYGRVEALRAIWRDPEATFDTATVPGLDERAHTSAGVFRDPRLEREVIDYAQCHQEIVAGNVIHFCRAAKESWPRPLVTGVFYGYFFCMREMASGGHLEIERVLQSPFVDYLSAPLSYELDARRLGGSGHFRCLTESVTLHRKLWLSEMDHPTLLGDTFGREEPFRQTTVPGAIAVMRRNTAQSLVRGQGMWWYDFGPKGAGGWWDHPDLLAEVGRLKNLADSLVDKPYRPVADVLFVYDAECFYYLGLPRGDVDPVSFAAINRTIAQACHSGCAFDTVLLADLPLADLERYRVVVFAHTPCLTREQRAFIAEKVAKDGRTLVWVYAPGYTDGDTLDLARMADVTGMGLKQVTLSEPPAFVVGANALAPGSPEIRLGTDVPVHPLFGVKDDGAAAFAEYAGTGHAALAKKSLAESTSWFCGLPLRDPNLMRAIFREGGAHVYSEQGDAIVAGGGILCIHTEPGGARSIQLPGGGRVETEVPPRSTTLFDLKTGKRLIQNDEH